MIEIADKYKYKINEMNEKIIILNNDTKKVIIDTAVENTLYNIVSDAANGQTDLTEKQKIYFFLDKTMKPIDTEIKNEISKNNEEKEKEDKEDKEEKKEEKEKIQNKESNKEIIEEEKNE